MCLDNKLDLFILSDDEKNDPTTPSNLTSHFFLLGIFPFASISINIAQTPSLYKVILFKFTSHIRGSFPSPQVKNKSFFRSKPFGVKMKTMLEFECWNQSFF